MTVSNTMFSDKSRIFLCDKNQKPIFIGQKLTNGKDIYEVISERYFGLSIRNIKTKSIEMLTKDIARQLEIVVKPSLGEYFRSAAIRVNDFRKKYIVRREL